MYKVEQLDDGVYIWDGVNEHAICRMTDTRPGGREAAFIHAELIVGLMNLYDLSLTQPQTAEAIRDLSAKLDRKYPESSLARQHRSEEVHRELLQARLDDEKPFWDAVAEEEGVRIDPAFTPEYSALADASYEEALQKEYDEGEKVGPIDIERVERMMEDKDTPLTPEDL